MTGYLARLAGRAAEPSASVPPLVRPRVPSRFEVPGHSHDTEDPDQLSSPPAAHAGHTAAPHGINRRVGERSPRSAAEQRGSDSSSPASRTIDDSLGRRPRNVEPEPRPTRIAEDGRSPSAPDERDGPATPSSSHPESRGPGAASPPRHRTSADEDDGRRPSTVGGDTSAPVTAAWVRARPTPRPVDDLDLNGHSSRRAGTTPEDRPAETVVSIHIGRVDVRTPSPAASRTTATHRARPTPEPGRLTLSEFLRGEREPR
jgi:hypothetical protein